MKKYNVFVAGAGLAGLSLAKELAGMGLSVLVIDKKKRAGQLGYHSSGTFMNPDEYGIPHDIFYAIEKVIFSSKNQVCSKKVENCNVIDRARLYEWMEKAALKDPGIKIRYGCELTGVKYGFGRVESVTYNDHDRPVDVMADLYVDCTGTVSFLGRKIGLTPKKSVMALGVEHLVPLKEESKTVYLYTGGNLGGGYGWVFPKSGTQAITGAGLIRPELFGKINEIFEEMWVKRNMSDICKRKSIAKNFAALRTGRPLGSFVKANVLVLGDSAHQASPLIGEGIRFILDASKDAASCIKQAYALGNMGLVKKYGAAWRKKYYKNFRFLYFIQRILRTVTMNDSIMDKGVKVLRCCNEYQYRRLLSGDIDLGFIFFIVADAWHKIKILKTKV